jgi:hypothetical protein
MSLRGSDEWSPATKVFVMLPNMCKKQKTNVFSVCVITLSCIFHQKIVRYKQLPGNGGGGKNLTKNRSVNHKLGKEDISKKPVWIQPRY